MLLASFSVDTSEEAQQEEAVHRLLDAIRANILSAIDGETIFAETFTGQLLHNFRLLQTFASLEGRLLLPHQETIIQLLTSVYGLQFDVHFKHTDLLASTLWTLFNSLGTVYLINRSYSSGDSFSEGVNCHLPLLLPEEIPARWHLPSEGEVAFVRRLLSTFVYPQMKLLQQFATVSSSLDELSTGQVKLSPAQLEKSVALLMSIEGLKSPFYRMAPLVEDTK